MVITIEPGTRVAGTANCPVDYWIAIGVYIPPDSAYPKHFHNIGIRIEVRFTTADFILCLTVFPLFQDEVLVHQVREFCGLVQITKLNDDI